MNAEEALAYHGYQPICDCNHSLEDHRVDGCSELDSYGVACSCPSYDAQKDPESRLPSAVRRAP